MDVYPATYYSKSLEHLPHMTHIIGHLPHLPNGPANIRDCIYKGDTSIKIILVNHEAPYNEKGDLDEDQLEFWCKSSDVVISVGRPLYDFTERILMHSNSYIKHDLYLPSCPVDFLKYDWLDYHKTGNRGHLTGPQNVLVCCPNRQMSDGLNFQTAVESVTIAGNFLQQTSESCDQMKVTLALTTCHKDRNQWEKDFYNIIERQFELRHRMISLSLHENDSIEEMTTIMKRADLLIHPQKHDCSYLGLDILCAASMGVPILVQDHSSIACLLESIHSGSSPAVKRLNNKEPEVNAWARMIVDKLEDPERAAEQASAIKAGLLRDTSIHTSHITFVKNILGEYTSI